MMSEDLIWEVLVRLPTKSLMRFKCVCKLWYSIIRSLKFAVAHGATRGGCFRGLLIRDIYYNYKGNVYFQAQSLYYVNLNDCPKMQHQLIIHESEQYSSFTPVVKGLIGLYDNGISNFTLCNIATHEFLKLPPSPSPPPDAYCEFYYSLGFDVVKEVFKVLSICHCFDEDDNVISRTTHVFNLGVNNSDTNWREIAPTPLDLYVKDEQCLCIDGVLYWRPSDDFSLTRSKLTVFHLSNETFETIASPEFRLQEGSADLVEICGRPALVVIELKTDYDSMLNVWTLRRGGELDAWTRKRVVLPPGLHDATVLDYANTLKYAATLPTGEMMLSFGDSVMAPLCIYIYDHLKNEFDSITVEEYGFDWGVTDSRWNFIDTQLNGLQYEEMKICYYEENIIPLTLLMSNQKLEDQTINTS